MLNRPAKFIVELIYSPNRTRRSLYPWIKPRVILFHHTGSSNIDGTVSWFLNRKSKVSSDFVIGRDGRIVRMVPKGSFGWHAGECVFKNKRTRLFNPLSFGLELVNKGDGTQDYPEKQLEAAAYVVKLIQEECPTANLLKRHADVCYPLGRKNDPAGLGITDIWRAVKHYQPTVKLALE